MIDRKLFIAAIIVVALFSATSKSQDHNKPSLFSVRLGDAELYIPPPEGFEEASAQFEQIKTRFAATESPANDMLAVHLPKSTCELFRQGKDPNLTLWTKVSVLKTGRTTFFSNADFATVVAEFRKNGATMMDPDGPLMKSELDHLDRALSNMSSKDASVNITQPVNLGEFDVRPNVYGVLLLITFKVSTGAEQSVTPILGGMSFVRVKNRLVYFYTFQKYQSKADLKTVTTFSKNWTNMVLAAN